MWDYKLIENAVPQDAINRALRLLHLEIVNWGLPKEQIDEWHQTKTWFPTLRWHDEILALAEFIPKEYRKGDPCEAQILLHFPDENLEYELHPHKDQVPAWASGRKYDTICGVCLSDNESTNGGFQAWHQMGDMWQVESVAAKAGDILVFNPDLYHSGGLNASGAIRYVVYFRYLEPK